MLLQEDPAAKGPDLIRAMQTKRFKDVMVVQSITDTDEAWRKGMYFYIQSSFMFN